MSLPRDSKVLQSLKTLPPTKGSINYSINPLKMQMQRQSMTLSQGSATSAKGKNSYYNQSMNAARQLIEKKVSMPICLPGARRVILSVRLLLLLKSAAKAIAPCCSSVRASLLIASNPCSAFHYS